MDDALDTICGVCATNILNFYMSVDDLRECSRMGLMLAQGYQKDNEYQVEYCKDRINKIFSNYSSKHTCGRE